MVSNGLKFTGKGGSVTVEACFVPDPVADPKSAKSAKSIKTTRGRPSMGRLLSVDRAAGFLMNAMQGPETPRAEVVIHGRLRIVCTDTGAGISPENQRRLFKEVVQFQPEILQAGGGSGLGLWITKGIIGASECV